MKRVKLMVDQLAITMDGRRLFAPLTFEVTMGERVALVGPSGVGKSTALRALADLVPFEGDVRLDPPVASRPSFRRTVTYVSQAPIMWSGTVETNLAQSFLYTSASEVFDRSRATSELSALGLDISLDRDAASLSGGEQQRVQLVRALLVNPCFLLLDEPTSALDEVSARRVTDRVEAFEGGVVLVSHDLAWARDMASRVINVSPA